MTNSPEPRGRRGGDPVSGGRIPGLDLLRAAAILLVMLGHQELFSGFKAQTGPTGVDLFFVLSGFLIGGILFDMGAHLARPRLVLGFWIRRWLRTLPNYYLFLGINILVWLPFWRPHVLAHVIPPYLVFLQNFAHRPAFFFYGETWSLCVEEWFYIFFPLVLLACLYAGLRFGRAYALTVAALIAVSLGLRFAAGTPKDWGFDLNMVVIYKFDALGCGAAAAALMRGWPNAWRSMRLPALVIGLAVAAACLAFKLTQNMEASYFGRTLFPTVLAAGWSLTLPWASTCMALPGGAFDAAISATARWSYSLYLVNFQAAAILTLNVLPYLPAGWIGIVTCEVIFVVFCYAASAALYRWFEGPILALRSRFAVAREAGEAQRAAH